MILSGGPGAPVVELCTVTVRKPERPPVWEAVSAHEYARIGRALRQYYEQFGQMHWLAVYRISADMTL